MSFERITVEPDKLEDEPCIRGLPITVETGSRLAVLLVDASHDATHVRDLWAGGSSDPQIVERHPPQLAVLPVGCIEQFQTQLTTGALVALTPTSARVRRLLSL